MVAKDVGGEKDNPTEIDREAKIDREIAKLNFLLYINLRGCVTTT
jgi:hypothetical protein